MSDYVQKVLSIQNRDEHSSFCVSHFTVDNELDLHSTETNRFLSRLNKSRQSFYRHMILSTVLPYILKFFVSIINPDIIELLTVLLLSQLSISNINTLFHQVKSL